MKIYADGGFKKKSGGYGSFRVFNNDKLPTDRNVKSMSGWTDQEPSRFIQTHNEAEYMTLVEALTWFITKHPTETQVHVYMDSLLVVKQVKKEWQIKSDTLRIFLEEVWALVALLDDFQISHVPREQIVDVLGH